MHRTFALLLVPAVLLAGPARAHHSFAMFDPAKVVTLQGKVKNFAGSTRMFRCLSMLPGLRVRAAYGRSN